MNSSPGFEGANEPRLLFQAVLKWSLSCISLAEDAQQILHRGAVGVMQKIRPWRARQEDGADCAVLSATTRSACDAAGLQMSRGCWVLCARSLQFLHPARLRDKPMTLCHCKHTLGFPERCVSLAGLLYVCIVDSSSHLCT